MTVPCTHVHTNRHTHTQNVCRNTSTDTHRHCLWHSSMFTQTNTEIRQQTHTDTIFGIALDVHTDKHRNTSTDTQRHCLWHSSRCSHRHIHTHVLRFKQSTLSLWLLLSVYPQTSCTGTFLHWHGYLHFATNQMLHIVKTEGHSKSTDLRQG